MANTVDIRILGISGSPVKDGNCDTLTKEALKMASKYGGVETDFVTLAGRNISSCQHCQWCIANRSPCKIEDDLPDILDRIREADGLLLGGPIWKWTLSSPLINLYSRLRYVDFFTPDLRNKVVGALVCGWFGLGADRAMDVIETIVKPSMQIPVAQASVIVSEVAHGKRAAYMEHGGLADKVGMQMVDVAVSRVVEVTRMVRFAKNAGVGLPIQQQRMITGGRVKPRKAKAFVQGVWRDLTD
jgi:multimeric flavodoxin WrbA